jgi:alkaline phosphatase
MKKRIQSRWTLAMIAMFIFAAGTLQSCGCKTQQDNKSTIQTNIKAPKYIFYLIGDGMASPQINMAEAALLASQTPCEKDTVGIAHLNLRQLNAAGMANTHAQNRYITGSAAAATALATGHKTSINTIGMDPAKEKPYASIAEMAKQKGMKVGIVTSVSIDHATPAGFYAHVAERNMYEEIGNQLLTSDFDYFGGGSVRWNSRKTLTTAQEYSKAAAEKGFTYVDTRQAFEALNSKSGRVIATLNMLGEGGDVSDGSSLPYTIDQPNLDKENQIYLADFVRKGIELLDNEKGFFMMIESGKVDWGCHANDAVAACHEVLTLDKALGVILDFMQKHPNECLVVVTGDHECGGLTLGFSGTHYESSFKLLKAQKISYVKFAQRVKSWKEKGTMSFKKAMKVVAKNFGLGGKIKLSTYETNLLRQAFKKSMGGELKSLPKEVVQLRYGYYDPFTVTITHILANKAGINYASYSHTAVPVPVFAKGQGAALFNGYYDNTDIPKKIANIAQLGEIK